MVRAWKARDKKGPPTKVRDIKRPDTKGLATQHPMGYLDTKRPNCWSSNQFWGKNQIQTLTFSSGPILGERQIRTFCSRTFSSGPFASGSLVPGYPVPVAFRTFRRWTFRGRTFRGQRFVGVPGTSNWGRGVFWFADKIIIPRPR